MFWSKPSSSSPFLSPSPPRLWPCCSELSRTLRTPSTEPRYPLDAPRTFNHEFRVLQRRNRASRGRGNGAAAGPSSRRAPRPLFVPYRVRLVALVIVVALFLFGVAGNEIPVISKELTSSAAMAPPWSASAQASAPASFHPEPPDRFPTAQIAYPFGVM